MIRTSRIRIISLTRRSLASSCSPSTTRPPGRSRTGGPADVRELPADDTPISNRWSTSRGLPTTHDSAMTAAAERLGQRTRDVALTPASEAVLLGLGAFVLYWITGPPVEGDM